MTVTADDAVAADHGHASTCDIIAPPTPSSCPSSTQLPPSLLAFVRHHQLPLELFTRHFALPRFIRLNPRLSPEIERAAIERQLGTKLSATPLPSFLSLFADVQIADKDVYRRGAIYGMDLASGVSVLALDPQSGEHVLDLCCAPGNKLAMLADLMHQRANVAANATNDGKVDASSSLNFGSVTGVDWNYQRLAAARTLIRKYRCSSVRLFLADGQTFSKRPPRSVEELRTLQGHIIDLTQEATMAGTSSSASPAEGTTIASSTAYHHVHASRSSSLHIPAVDGSSSTDGVMVVRTTKRQKRALKKAEARQAWMKKQKAMDGGQVAAGDAGPETGRGEEKEDADDGSFQSDSAAATSPSSSLDPVPNVPLLYDRVLVDAECTHDGSVKHMSKMLSSSPSASCATSTSNSSNSASASISSLWSSNESKFLNPDRLASLQTLQRNLIKNGFRLLRPGGTMIYSTCSYSRAQNEEIVAWLLKQEADAETVHVFDGWERREVKKEAHHADMRMSGRIEEVNIAPGLPSLRYRCGALVGSASNPSSNTTSPNVAAPSSPTPTPVDYGIRLDPLVSGTSGLYIAKLRKKMQAANVREKTPNKPTLKPSIDT